MIIKAKYRLGGSFIKQVLGLKADIEPFDAATVDFYSPGGAKHAEDLRKTEVRWVPSKQHPGLYEELARIVYEHQAKLGVTVRLCFSSDMQLATYREGHHYTWHADVGRGSSVQRLISLSVLLNGGFDGGDLEFQAPGAPRLRKAGDIVMFNSAEIHRVAPVTRGVRHSLVAWFMKAG
jgi:PKHD-type hydroxylase